MADGASAAQLSRVVQNPYKKKRKYDVVNRREPSVSSHRSMSSVRRRPLEQPSPQQPQAETVDPLAAASLVIAASDKAGMKGVDRAAIDRIIMRESAGSRYMLDQQRRDAACSARIEVLKERLLKTEIEQPDWKSSIEPKLDQEEELWLSERPVRSTCVVVDMDMFYMACELLTRPDLLSVPACVGGGMILTSNYEARKYGVRSAMAGWIGDALVQELSGGRKKLIHVPAHHELYKDKSAIVKSVLQEYDPGLRMYSLDECYLDVGPYLVTKLEHADWNHTQIRDHLKTVNHRSEQSIEEDHFESKSDHEDVDDWGNHNKVLALSSSSTILERLNMWSTQQCLAVSAEIVLHLRKAVEAATGGLTCSAGLAPTFMLAKMASDANKPDGQCVVGSDHAAILEFLHPQPLRKVPGIGRVTHKSLHAFGMETVKDLYNQRALVRLLWTPALALFLCRVAVGCSGRSTEGEDDEDGSVQKGMSRERTFVNCPSWPELHSKLEDVATKLSQDMQKKSLFAKNLTLKVKFADFSICSKSRTVEVGVQAASDLARHATELLHQVRQDHAQPVRLLGLRCSHWTNRQDSTRQRTLLDYQRRNNASSASSAPTCPVCAHIFGPNTSNADMNQHVDACLNGAAVQQAVREQRQQQQEQRKRVGLANYFRRAT